jgi:hypothetical protein
LDNKDFCNMARAAPKPKVKDRPKIEPNYWLDFNTSAVPAQRFDLWPAPLPIAVLQIAQRRF